MNIRGQVRSQIRCWHGGATLFCRRWCRPPGPHHR